MTEEFWQKKLSNEYKNIDKFFSKFNTIDELIENSYEKYADLPAFTNFGKTITYKTLFEKSTQFASYLQNHTNLKKGDRVAIQLPNILQYPIAALGVVRAGLVLVNTNPQYTCREMKVQFKDSGVKCAIVLENFAHNLDKIIEDTDIEHVIVTSIGEMLAPVKGFVLNIALRHIKKVVPEYSLPGAITFKKALKIGSKHTFSKPNLTPDDITILQYTGGTTGVAKGAMLSHENLLNNVYQCLSRLNIYFRETKEVCMLPLPIYHIFCFTFGVLINVKRGNHSILITNPRDIPGFVKELSKWDYTLMLGVNTLFSSLCNNEKFKKLNFKSLRLSIAGGMALTAEVGNKWKEITKNEILEGYGLSETSPVVCVNDPKDNRLGTIGQALVKTQLKIIDANGNDLPIGDPNIAGELCIKGPQVMKGYWNSPDETKEVLNDGWFKSGDIASILPDGHVKIVDRKKDMILVSGFNVYPNELEEVLYLHEDIIECAAIGVPDKITGEKIKMYVVSKNPDLTEEEVKKFLKDKLTPYKRPRQIVFRGELPKSTVGKILRKDLRAENGDR